MKRIVNIKEEPEIVAQLQRVAASEGTTLSAIYRRAARLFLSTVPTNGKPPKDQPESIAA
jgi:hypothetical protein